MSVRLRFEGWFQCRLATDPDPADEPRGVSGYVRAVAGEPDLDRIIRLQPKNTVPRSHCPEIGVRVVKVTGDSDPGDQHPLVGAEVDLLDDPKFEGRNRAAADDGFEAIVPLHVRIRKEEFVLQRRFTNAMRFPPETNEDRAKFAELQATGLNFSPGAIADATGIADLAEVWRNRITNLEADLEQSDEQEDRKAAAEARIASMLVSETGRPVHARLFSAQMLWSVALNGQAIVTDPRRRLSGNPVTSVAWIMDFWLGAWDADALSGYMVGYLSVPVGDASRAHIADVAQAVVNPDLRRG